MFIKAWCPNCNWEGIAEVGNGISIRDYQCPICGWPYEKWQSLKRPYRGIRDLRKPKATLRKKGG